jgi:hypothetical protein
MFPCTTRDEDLHDLHQANAALTEFQLLDFVARSGFPAEKVTTILADWEDAPTAYTEHTTKLALLGDPWTSPPDPHHKGPGHATIQKRLAPHPAALPSVLRATTSSALRPCPTCT